MRKNISILLFLFIAFKLSAEQFPQKPDVLPENQFFAFFAKAYQAHPSIPKGILEAVAYTNSRFHHITHNVNDEESCIGLPKSYGVMGLIADGKNYFQNNLSIISIFSG